MTTMTLISLTSHDAQEIEVVHVAVAGGEAINLGEDQVDVGNVDNVNDHVFQRRFPCGRLHRM